MLPDVLKKEVLDFKGPWLRVDPYTIVPQNGLFAQNVSYIRGQVTTRYGTSTVFTPNEAIGSMYNWLPNVAGVPRNFLIWYAPSYGVRLIDLNNIAGGITNVVTNAVAGSTGATGAIFADSGSRIYIAFYNSAGVGVGGGIVYSYSLGAADPLFAAPLTTVPTATEPGVGVVTAGPHRFAYLVQTRNGYTTKPSPVTGGLDTFAPVLFTASGAKNINLSFTATYPVYASQVQILMTTSVNLNKYYIVPGAQVSVPGGGAFTVNATFSISDDDLVANATPADPYFNLLSTTVAGTVPFSPSFICTYSNRMVYVTLDGSGLPVSYISDANNYQSLTAALHGVYLPGNRQQVTALPLRGVLYILGPHGTFSCADNGQVPTLWSQPQQVDSKIGTYSPYGVYENASQGFAWVADEGGLYLFLGGQFPTIPVSYYQSTDWARINWNVPTTVQIVDDSNNKRVEVLASLDGATSPTHRLVWDYTDGIDAGVVKYSINSITGTLQGCIAWVQNNATKHQEVWAGPSNASYTVIRNNDGSEALPYRDPGPNAIDCIYEGALQPGQDGQHGQIHLHHGAFLRVRGAGVCTPTFYSLDHSANFPSPGITLAGSPGLEVLALCYLMSEHVSLQLRVNSVDGYLVLAKMVHLYTNGPTRRS